MAEEIIRDIEVMAGVEPITDATPHSTRHYTYANNIRFNNGRPEKRGGHEAIVPLNRLEIQGCSRGVYSYFQGGAVRRLIGTNERLYYFDGQQLFNVTPLSGVSLAIPNSLSTHYVELGNDPVVTTEGESQVRIIDIGTKARTGDYVTLQGLTSVGGIPDAQLNSVHYVYDHGPNYFVINPGVVATSDATGGGNAGILSSGLVTIQENDHLHSEGDRIGVFDAEAFGGITEQDINRQLIIRNVSPNAYDAMTPGTATSAVVSAGGADTMVQGQIEPGECDAGFATGYGMGPYGVGTYGTPKVSSTLFIPARLWSFGAFGTKTVLTPGGGGKAYIWDGNVDIAPTVIPGAPEAINYIYVQSTSIGTLGGNNIGNRYNQANQGFVDQWTPDIVTGSTAFVDDVEDADIFICQANCGNISLFFTRSQVFIQQFVGYPKIWDYALIDKTSGIIGQNAYIDVNGICYFMGEKNFYRYRGGRVEVVPSNSRAESTIKKWVFEHINREQQSKSFAWYNPKFNEVWFHFPRGENMECSHVARVCLSDMSWTMDTSNMVAAERPAILGEYPVLVGDDNILYYAEKGYNAGEEPMPFELHTPFFQSGKDRLILGGVLPDSTQTGDIQLTTVYKNRARSVSIGQKGPITIVAEPETDKEAWIDYTATARYWQHQITGSDLDQFWQAGNWQEKLVAPAGNR